MFTRRGLIVSLAALPGLGFLRGPRARVTAPWAQCAFDLRPGFVSHRGVRPFISVWKDGEKLSMCAAVDPATRRAIIFATDETGFVKAHGPGAPSTRWGRRIRWDGPCTHPPGACEKFKRYCLPYEVVFDVDVRLRDFAPPRVRAIFTAAGGAA